MVIFMFKAHIAWLTNFLMIITAYLIPLIGITIITLRTIYTRTESHFNRVCLPHRFNHSTLSLSSPTLSNIEKAAYSNNTLNSPLRSSVHQAHLAERVNQPNKLVQNREREREGGREIESCYDPLLLLCIARSVHTRAIYQTNFMRVAHSACKHALAYPK